jgi:O-antigen/teichoic acid export membrane protein
VTLRSLARGSLLYTVGTFLPRLGALLLLPVYTLTMSPAQFGVVSLMISVSTLLSIAYRLGLDGALLRFHFDVPAEDRPRLYISLATVTLVVAVGASLVLGAASAPFFSRLFTGVSFLPFGVVTLGITATTALQYIPTVAFRAAERPGLFLAFSAGVMVVSIVASVILLIPLHLGPTGALLGQLAGGIFGVLVGAWLILRMRPARVDQGMVRQGLAFGVPLVPHAISGWVLNVSDRWLLGLLLGTGALATQAAIGVYSLGYQIGQVVSLVALSFNAAWGPFFYARGEQRAGPGILREMTTVVTGLLALLAVLLALAAPDVIHVVAPPRWGEARSQAVDVLQIVALASFLYSVYFMVVSAVFLTRRTAFLPLLTFSAGAANVVLNVLLIPRIGIIGAAWSSVAGYGILAIATYLYARRGYPLQLDLARISTLTLVGIALVIGGRWLSPNQPSLPSIALQLGEAVAYAALVAVVIRRPIAKLRRLLAERPATLPADASGRIPEPQENA